MPIWEGTIQYEGAVSRKIRLTLTRFRGPLHLDENKVHGFALVLQKQPTNFGKGESLVFGKSTRGIEVRFRLAEDRTGLIGMAREFRSAKEFMEFQRVEAAKQ